MLDSEKSLKTSGQVLNLLVLSKEFIPNILTLSGGHQFWGFGEHRRLERRLTQAALTPEPSTSACPPSRPKLPSPGMQGNDESRGGSSYGGHLRSALGDSPLSPWKVFLRRACLHTSQPHQQGQQLFWFLLWGSTLCNSNLFQLFLYILKTTANFCFTHIY